MYMAAPLLNMFKYVANDTFLSIDFLNTFKIKGSRSAVTKHHRIQTAGSFDQAGSQGGIQTCHRTPWRIAVNDAALLQQGLACKQTALAVFIINERQPSFIGGESVFATAREISVDDLS